jgi:hypothetical protein
MPFRETYTTVEIMKVVHHRTNGPAAGSMSPRNVDNHLQDYELRCRNLEHNRDLSYYYYSYLIEL